MKWKIKFSYEEKRNLRNEIQATKKKYYDKWQPFFTIFPRKIGNTWYWFETIERRPGYIGNEQFGWKFRDPNIPPENVPEQPERIDWAEKVKEAKSIYDLPVEFENSMSFFEIIVILKKLYELSREEAIKRETTHK